MDFNGVDLNLLAAFNALMQERNVTRAAARMDISQPAMSAALARLRRLFGDRLFQRSATGLLPTPRANELAEPVFDVLQRVGALLAPEQHFDSAKAALRFGVGVSEYPAFVLLPNLLGALLREAPGIDVDVHAFSARDEAVALLDAGKIDLAIGVAPTLQESRILSRPILHDEFVTLVRRDA
jgi:DNA-binding transcriptional LysR family regulator